MVERPIEIRLASGAKTTTHGISLGRLLEGEFHSNQYGIHNRDSISSYLQITSFLILGAFANTSFSAIFGPKLTNFSVKNTTNQGRRQTPLVTSYRKSVTCRPSLWFLRKWVALEMWIWVTFRENFPPITSFLCQ